MPSLQLELKKLENLSFDDEGSDKPNGRTTLPHAFRPTNNVSRETFNYVKNHPGVTCTIMGAEMEKKGFKRSSTVSLATQFVRQGIMRASNHGLYVTQDEYTPIKAAKTFKHKKPSKDVLPPPQKKVAKVTDSLAPTVYISGFNTQSPKDILDSMSIATARCVYDELKKIFGS